MDKNKDLLCELKDLRLQSFVEYLDQVEFSDKSLRESRLELFRYEYEWRYSV